MAGVGKHDPRHYRQRAADCAGKKIEGPVVEQVEGGDRAIA